MHRLANNTGQTQRSLTIGQRSRKRIGLSGTPITNSLESVFYPLLILDGGKSLGASKTAFLEKFFTKEQRGQFSKNIPNEGAAEAIAAAMAESTHFVTKEEVLPDLPLKTHTPLYLDMTAEQERYYHQLKTEAITYIQDAEVTVEQASARMMKLLQVCQGFVLTDSGGRHFNNVKTDTLLELLTDTLHGRKVIIWAFFKYEIAQIMKLLREHGIEAVHVDGDVTSDRQRDLDADRWNNDPSLKVFVRQLGMSEGETLMANKSGIPCYDNIYIGLSYKYIEWKQSQDRIHRLGQRYPCSYTYLLTDNGLDKAVYESVLQKAATANFVHTHGKDYFLNLLRAA
jgi:SNF2 family DNA or RNA helicase